MLMLYFSGTGNSKYIAKQFAANMSADCHSIEENIDFTKLLSESDTVAVCYPIYGSCVPRIFREFVAQHTQSFAGKKLILFCTQMLFSGDGSRAFARLLPCLENQVIYAEHFRMPNNICNFWLFPVKDKERIRKKRAADRKLEQVCKDIQNGIVKRRGWNYFSTFLGKTQNLLWPIIERNDRGSFTVDNDCNRCGLCVRCCPVQNLALTENGIQQKNNCILCYRCANICPKKAATVMLHTKPKRQYKGITDNCNLP